jgi:elongation factor Ts
VDISVELVKELRQRTGAGVLDCRKALVANEGDVEKAANYLREKGLIAAAQKAEREATEGIVESYGHPGGRVGVLVEVNCETDFVARTVEFQTFVHDIALHIAAMAPRYVSPEDVPTQVLARKKESYRSEAQREGKPERIIDRIVEGRLKKFYADICLLEQPFVRDEDVLVKDLVQAKIAELKENIVVRRFERYELGLPAEEE